MVHAHAGRQRHALVFFGLVGHHHHLPRALGRHRMGNLRHAVPLGALAHRLAAGHGHRVVVEDLVGDVDAGRNGLADGQQAAVKVGAITNVGEHMRFVDEGRLADPGHALATHLREAGRGTVHPQGHEMAADAGHGARTFGHLGGGVVRTARTKPGGALSRRRGAGQRRLARGQDGQVRVHARGRGLIDAQALEPRGDGFGNQGRGEVGAGAQQRVRARIGHAPLAAAVLARHVVKFAQHMRAHVGAPVVELLLELVFDDLALFFDDQDFLQAGSELARALRLQRPDHPHLVQAQPDSAAGGLIKAQIAHRLAGVVVGLAAGHDAQPVLRSGDDGVVEPVGADVGQRRIPLVVKQPRLLLQGGVGPADVHAAGGHVKVGAHDLHPVGIDLHAGRGLDNFLDGLHAGPDTGKAAHGQRMQAHVQNFLHAGRKKHRQATGLEDVIALVSRRRALGHMVVAGHRQHPAPGGGAGHIGVLEHIGAAVHARALAIPDAKDPVEFARSLRRKAQLLRAPNGRGRQLFVDAGLKMDVLRLQVALGLPQGLVVAAQGGAAVAADEACRVLAQALVALALQHGQAHQSLHAAHERIAALQSVFVVERDRFERAQQVLGQGGIHGWVS